MTMTMEFYTGNWHVRLVPSFNAEGITLGLGTTKQAAILAAEEQLRKVFGHLRENQHELLLAARLNTMGGQYADA